MKKSKLRNLNKARFIQSSMKAYLVYVQEEGIPSVDSIYRITRREIFYANNLSHLKLILSEMGLLENLNGLEDYIKEIK